jgi:hypothetical protein
MLYEKVCLRRAVFAEVSLSRPIRNILKTLFNIVLKGNSFSPSTFVPESVY